MKNFKIIILFIIVLFLIKNIFFTNSLKYIKKEKNIIFIQLYNHITGEINYHKYKNDYKFSIVIGKLFKRRNGNIYVKKIQEIDSSSINNKLRNCLDENEKKKIKLNIRNGLVSLTGIKNGHYEVRFSAFENGIFVNTTQKFEIKNRKILGLDKIENVYRFPVKLSLYGRSLYYFLISIIFLTFFIGISLIIIQNIAFKGIPFMSILGSSIVILSWAVALGKLPVGVRIPIFTVQFFIYIIMLRFRNLDSLPLPFLTKSYIQSKKDFLFQTGVLLDDLKNNMNGKIRLKDKWNNLFNLNVKIYSNEQNLKCGTLVRLIDYDENLDLYFVQAEENLI